MTISFGAVQYQMVNMIVGQLTAQVSWLGPTVGSDFTVFNIHHMNWGNSRYESVIRAAP